jgi:hypothetical protein
MTRTKRRVIPGTGANAPLTPAEERAVETQGRVIAWQHRQEKSLTDAGLAVPAPFENVRWGPGPADTLTAEAPVCPVTAPRRARGHRWGTRWPRQ